MSERTELLIQQIIDATKGRLSEAEIKSLTDEVRAHLDASVQARVESHQSAADAEQEAISQFGPVEDFVAAVLARKGKGFGKATFACFLGGLLGIGTIFAVQNQVGGAGSWFVWTFSAVGILWLITALWTGWRANRLQLGSMIAAYCLAVPLTAALLSFVAVGDLREPLGEFPKTDLSFRVGLPAYTQNSIQRQRQKFATAEQLALAQIKSSAGPYNVPVIIDGDRTLFKRAKTSEQAMGMLKSQETRNEHQWSISLQASQEISREAARRLQVPFLKNTLLLLPLSSTLLGVTWLIAALVYSLGAITAAATKGTLLRRTLA